MGGVLASHPGGDGGLRGSREGFERYLGVIRPFFARTLPDVSKYLVIDIEYIGINEGQAIYPIQFAVLVVRDGMPVYEHTSVVDWTRTLRGRELTDLDYQLFSLSRPEHRHGLGWRFTGVEALRAEGRDIRDCLADVRAQMQGHGSGLISAQSVVYSEVRVLKYAFARWGACDWEPWPNSLFDPGLLYRASVVHDLLLRGQAPPGVTVMDVAPKTSETHREFFSRIYVKPRISGLLWNLRHVAETLGALPAEEPQWHDALADARITAYLTGYALSHLMPKPDHGEKTPGPARTEDDDIPF